MSDRLIVGLTGGIGSGKTLVSDTFATLGAHVIDTDVISRELTNHDPSTIKEIQRALGEEILEDGLINRSILRDLVFNDISAKEKLEKILHPKIRDMVVLALKDHIDSYAVVVIPLLTEKGAYSFINRILVVDCDEQLQIERVSQRSNLNKDMIMKIIDTQASREERKLIADDMITNNADKQSLIEQVKELHRMYLEISRCEKD